MHFRRHIRFYAAGAIGVATFFASVGHPYAFRLTLAGDVFSASYLTMMAIYAANLTPDHLRRRGEDGDEGLAIIFALALLVLSVSVGSLFVILNRPGEDGLVPALLAMASVPLGWAMLHTVAAFHYATMFYSRAAPGDPTPDPSGLEFPRTTTPGVTEFLYFSFVLGMAAQVSDVIVCSTRMRRAVLIHSTASFFYNTVLLALTVNVALTFAGGP